MFGSILIIATLKGTVMLAAAGLLTVVLRRGSAAARHASWCAALVSLLVFSAVGNGLEQWQVAILPVELFPDEIATAQAPFPANEVPVVTENAVPAVVDTAKESNPAKQLVAAGMSWQPAILMVWLIGVLLVLARLAVGTVRVRRMVRGATPLTDSWTDLSRELSHSLKLAQPVRLLRSNESLIPMTSGVWSPVVLLPNEADEWSPDRRRVVLLHELVHVKRRDLLTQTLAQIAGAFYWFNPLVWLAVRQLRKEQEWACDERVLASGIKASDYAGHLLEIGRRFYTRSWPAVTTTAIVRHSQLEQRLRAILKPTLQRSHSRTKAAAVFVLGAVFILLAGTQLAGSRSVASNSLLSGERVSLDQAGTSARQATAQIAGAVAKQSPENNQSPRQTPSPSPANQPAANDPGDDQMAEQVFNSFSVEDRNRLLNNGIGPAYIKEMAGAGYRQLTAAQLIALYSNVVRADYVESLQSVGYPSLSPADIIALRSNGITAEVIKSFQAVKYADFQATNYIAFRSNGVPPSYLKSMTAAGYDKLTPKQIVDMWVAGVTGEFIRDARRGNANPSPEELIELKKREKP